MELASMTSDDIRSAYRRWAPVYDATFGRLVRAGVTQAVTRANELSGELLEIGVGTGLALPQYGSHLSVRGVDLSLDILERARRRVQMHDCRNIHALLQMDAAALTFPDSHFDICAAIFVLTVVPEPQKVIAELARVTKRGGTILLANHFSVEHGLRGIIEKKMSKHAAKLGWRPEFPMNTVLKNPKLRVCSIKQLKPWGFFTLIQFQRLV